MTVKELINYFEGYYGGKYTGYLLDTMIEYLNEYNEQFLSACAKVIVLRYSSTYGKLPNVAIIEQNLEEIEDSIPEPEPLPELPDPDWKPATPEETAEFIAQMKSIFKSATPMAKTLLSVVENIGKEVNQWN